MTEPVVERVVETVLPTRHGTFRLVGYRGVDGVEHVSLSQGIVDGRPPAEPPLVRVHSECLTGDTLGSRRCDCGEQLDAALARIAEVGVGCVVYVRGHEGRGIGLVEKLRAYKLQDAGVDTVDANLTLGHPADLRRYDQAADILRDLGVPSVRLMSSNPAKSDALTALGIEVVDRVGMFVGYHPENQSYLRTKRARMNHDRPATEVSATVATRYSELMAGAAWVIAQSAQSMDGFIATRTGDGVALSGDEDHVHLHTLRALADAVVVGAGTVVADDPRLTVRLVPGDSPMRVVLDPQGRTPASATVFTDGGPTLWLVGAGVPARPGVETIVLDEAGFAPSALVALLAERGLRRVLVEGGGRTVSRFWAAEALDRLFVTVVPVFLGEGVPGVRVAGVGRVAEAARIPTRQFAVDSATCTEFLLRDVR